MTPEPVLPEVRQCIDPDNPNFGRCATAALDQFTGEPRPGVWFVGNPRVGGHWTHTSEAEGADIEKTWVRMVPAPEPAADDDVVDAEVTEGSAP